MFACKRGSREVGEIAKMNVDCHVPSWSRFAVSYQSNTFFSVLPNDDISVAGMASKQTSR